MRFGTARAAAVRGIGPPLSLAADKSSVTGRNYKATTATTDSVTITPSGGVTPFTYAWSIISGSATITSASAATTTFSKTTSSTAGATTTATARCTVTSSDGQVATKDVTVNVIAYWDPTALESIVGWYSARDLATGSYNGSLADKSGLGNNTTKTGSNNYTVGTNAEGVKYLNAPDTSTNHNFNVPNGTLSLEGASVFLLFDNRQVVDSGNDEDIVTLSTAGQITHNGAGGNVTYGIPQQTWPALAGGMHMLAVSAMNAFNGSQNFNYARRDAANTLTSTASSGSAPSGTLTGVQFLPNEAGGFIDAVFFNVDEPNGNEADDLTEFETKAQLLEGYFAWELGLTATLPSGHPYKAARP
jgi:hypothetical protein